MVINEFPECNTRKNLNIYVKTKIRGLGLVTFACRWGGGWPGILVKSTATFFFSLFPFPVSTLTCTQGPHDSILVDADSHLPRLHSSPRTS